MNGRSNKLTSAFRFLRLTCCSYLILIVAFVVPHHVAHAGKGEQLLEAMLQMVKPKLIDSVYQRIDSLTINSRDFSLTLENGKLWLFEPITIDGQVKHYSAFFEGSGRLLFSPRVETERYQMRRFFESDSLNREISNVLLFFNDSLFSDVMNGSEQVLSQGKPVPKRKARKELEYLTNKKSKRYLFPVLKNLVQPRRRPFLQVGANLNKGGRVVFRFDPYAREEVTLHHYYQPATIKGFFETVCSYSVLIDSQYVNINGIDKTELTSHHFITDVKIANNGKLKGKAECQFTVSASPARIVSMYLYEEMKIDSVVDESGNKVAFYRYKKKKYASTECYLFFDEPHALGDEKRLIFYYNGEIAKNIVGNFYLHVGSRWYPRYSNSHHATFDMTFRVDKKYNFIASGKLTESTTEGNTSVTQWKVEEPSNFVGFNIGLFKPKKFKIKGAPPVEIYFSNDFHTSLLDYYSLRNIPLGRNMESQVADDILNSAAFFSQRFGPYPHDKLMVSEILGGHGQAFPGFIHLSYYTWVKTDRWGADRLFRAHETAHQWWGVEVDYETYHDQWMSEGFSEYSALLYVQAVAGNAQFLNHIKEMRDDIFSARKYVFGSGAESGSISMGYRTSSSKTLGDFSLIIYDKGAFVLHMLRNLLMDLKTLRDDKFFAMMREWYVAQSGKRATTMDFRKLTEKYTGVDMGWFFKQWVYGTDLPEYTFSYEIEKRDDGKYITHCRIEQREVSANFRMYVPIEVEFTNGGKFYMRALIDQPINEFDLPPIDGEIKKIRLNPFHSVLAKVKQ